MIRFPACSRSVKRLLEADRITIEHKIQQFMEDKVLEIEKMHAFIRRRNMIEQELAELDLLTNWDYPAA
jgi:hypothetical protein